MRHQHRDARAGRSGGVIHWARGYDVLTAVLFAGRGRRFRSDLSRHLDLKPGHRLLDVGCGTGTLALVFAEVVGAGGSVHGIDAAPEMIATATRKAARRQLPARFEVAAAQRLPFPADSMDAVVMSLALHHLPVADRPHAVSELLRVLRPEGHLAIVEFQAPTHTIGKAAVRHTFGPTMATTTLAPVVDLLSAAGAVDIQQSSTPLRWLGVVTAHKATPLQP